MASTQNNPVVRQKEFEAHIAEIAGAILELLNRTTRLAEVTAAIALVLRENGLIDLGVEENQESDTVEVDLNSILPDEDALPEGIEGELA